MNFECLENLNFKWEETVPILTSEENEELDPMMAIVLYTGFMEKNWSNLDLSNQDISSRNFTQTDFSNTNLSGANLANSDLSESIFFNVDLRGANLTGANLNNTVFVIQPQNIVGANFTGANLRGAFEYTGFVKLVVLS